MIPKKKKVSSSEEARGVGKMTDFEGSSEGPWPRVNARCFHLCVLASCTLHRNFEKRDSKSSHSLFILFTFCI